MGNKVDVIGLSNGVIKCKPLISSISDLITLTFIGMEGIQTFINAILENQAFLNLYERCCVPLETLTVNQ